MKSITIDLPDDLHARLKERSEGTGRAMKKEAVEILKQFLSDTREVCVTIDEMKTLEELRSRPKLKAE